MASRRAVTRSISLTEPVLAALALNSLLLAGADGPVPELPLDDLQPFGDLLLVGAGAVAAEQELDRRRSAPGTGANIAHQILADDVAVETEAAFVSSASRAMVMSLLRLSSADGPGCCCRGRATTITAAAPSCLSSLDDQARFAASVQSLRTPTRLDPGCFALVRRSTRETGHGRRRSNAQTHAAPLNVRDRRPSRPRRLAQRSARESTHSCRLTPPCAYSAPAMKLPIPGGQAIRTSGFQYQGRTGTSGWTRLGPLRIEPTLLP